MPLPPSGMNLLIREGAGSSHVVRDFFQLLGGGVLDSSITTTVGAPPYYKKIPQIFVSTVINYVNCNHE